MYAIIINGGKQYKIVKNKILRLEKINNKIGEIIKFEKILLFVKNKYIKIGNPFVENIIIEAEIINHGKDIKKKIIKFKRRKHHLKQIGHRQKYTEVKIIKIIK
ncbi:50S ribosomal protein L21 [Enterobacteriaceae bacterium ET-AT1-13]|nr:50S ribosomal protein L21 [Enterobacteriaceae bacterium ET-AT1-13]WGS66380.1 50S ribosomal protein L21 [Enterobacteriaceae bacterium Cmel17]WMC17406.1 MAG: 50S ribosomal protein L21 [Enterobacteriaceae bacterium Cmel21]WMC17612.1 MAG: 50S ribosomal protein L21 [Enterobacteriaceae bacterium PSmelAO3-2]WMC17817.1 MAG: 50S ribosomal protein L21 [Enterobacteriaceae bacterium PSmelAO3-1]WMC18020.1 MAG: 50S ribosomal protein L21 [Enterobacteriaceae bacterium PSmelAO1]